MSASEILEHFRRLPSREQHELLEILANEVDPDLSEADITELERRAEELRRYPERGIPLDVVREEMPERLRKHRK